MLKLKLQYFVYLKWRTYSLEKTLMLGKIEGRRRRGQQRMDGWMASPTQWTWVSVDSGTWTGKPGVLQSMGSKRVRHDWMTELNWTNSLLSWWFSCSVVSNFCYPKDCSTPGSSVHGIFQAGILEWAIFFSRGSSWSRNWTSDSCIAGRFLHFEVDFLPTELWGNYHCNTLFPVRSHSEGLEVGTSAYEGGWVVDTVQPITLTSHSLFCLCWWQLYPSICLGKSIGATLESSLNCHT